MLKNLCILISVICVFFSGVALAETFTSGELRMTIETLPEGARVSGLQDTATGTEMLSSRQLPLYSVTLKNAAKESVTVDADKGWSNVSLESDDGEIVVSWKGAKEERLGGLVVRVTARAIEAENAFHWSIEVQPGDGWTVCVVLFPQMAVGALGDHTAVLFPRGPGEVQIDPWTRKFSYDGRYPSGWTSMQFFAAYADGATRGCGLYFAHHDPMGSVKELKLDSDADSRSVRFAFEHHAPRGGTGVPPVIQDHGQDAHATYRLPGTAVLRLYRGDWFDAATIYRTWVKAEARWWPQLGADGRPDTPPWMRELSAWAQTGGTPAEVMDQVKDFAQWLGVPVGFHWYNWHQIPFDNDYPHYFPTKDGFADAVRDLQDHNVYVMPYINGRLWDTHDKGSEDAEFTSVAKPAVTKDENGEPYIEKYGSKEENGEPVQLGVMCPSTPLWQNTVKDVVLRLQNEMGVKGVYIDQVAAAAPALCMDAAHGHPLGGGAWWNEGYWQMLESIRRDMQPDRMLTTECNGEPFLHRFDGYLTWHWQYDGQVPAFPAVYGGAIQMFGRAYGGGDTADLAMRMKAGQQLVFGEQIGWLAPTTLRAMPSAEFFRSAVRLRHELRRYFHAGEMARPPQLLGDVPNVKADWKWSGEWWVTTSAVLTGAWRLPQEGRAVVIFANVSDAPVTAEIQLNPEDYGLTRPNMIVDSVRGEGVTSLEPVPVGGRQPVTLPPASVAAWELHY